MAVGYGGNHPMRPDQELNLARTRAGSGPAPSNVGVFRRVIVNGPAGGVFIYDAAGNLRSADVGAATTDPEQHIAVVQGRSTFNGHGAVITLSATALDAEFLYVDTGTSAQGAMIASNTGGANGTDPFGSNYLGQSFTVYGPPGAPSEALSMTGGTLQWFTGTPATGWTGLSALQGLTGALIPAFNTPLVVDSVSRTTSAALEVNGTATAASLDYTPAATAPPAAPTGAEPWNAVAMFSNGWSNFGAPSIAAQFRLVAAPPRSVEIIGSLASGGITGAAVFTLPVAYRPAHTNRFPVVLTTGVVPAAQMFGSVTAAGVVSLFNIPNAAGDQVDFHALISLDA
jgi:hypothetical protein